MIDEQLRVELLAMKAEDLRVREALLACGELSGPYAPQMEVVHKRNAEQLRKIIKIHGWPAEDVAGVDGAEAAWLIAQHAIGEPGFQAFFDAHCVQLPLARGDAVFFNPAACSTNDTEPEQS